MLSQFNLILSFNPADTFSPTNVTEVLHRSQVSSTLIEVPSPTTTNVFDDQKELKKENILLVIKDLLNLAKLPQGYGDSPLLI